MNILFVCSGNTCRSPMAEYILKDKLKKHKIKNVKVKSAGLSANYGDSISSDALKTLKNHNIRTYAFKSKKINYQLITESDLIICMTKNHKYMLNEFTENAVTISSFTGIDDIIDPFNKGLNEYEKTYCQLDKALDIVIEKIKNRSK